MDIKKLQITVPKWVFKRKTEVMYLVLGPDGLPKFKELLELGITDQLMEVVSKHVNAYIKEGAVPPAEIASPILNIADDMLSGRAPTIRTGDYIALQQFVRLQGK
jgi:hypothetical protein